MDSAELFCYAKIIAITAGTFLMAAAAARIIRWNKDGSEEWEKSIILLVLAVIFNVSVIAVKMAER